MTTADLAGDGTQSHYVLAELVGDRFRRGLTLDETIADLTIDAMKLGFETPETQITHFYQTCLTRQTSPEALARLAAMSAVNYEKLRKGEATRLKMRASVLDVRLLSCEPRVPQRKQNHLPRRRPNPGPSPWPAPRCWMS